LADLILSAAKRTSNAELMVEVRQLGYLEAPVCDFTPGTKDVWWKKLPDLMVVPLNMALVPRVDFRDTGLPDNLFKVVAYDPPYVAMGGRTTSGIPEFMQRYGLVDVPPSPKKLQEEVINPGLIEAARVASKYVLVKNKDYISSGKLWRGIYETQLLADSIGLVEVDYFTMVTGASIQPKGRRQVHARQNSSRLTVFQVPKEK